MLHQIASILLLVAAFSLNGGTCFSILSAESSLSSSATGQKRGIYGTPGIMKFSPVDGSTAYTGKVTPSNPINPFLSLKPFHPVKPTFFPPVVDPNLFINSKAKMLDSLFSSSTFGNIASDTGIPMAADSVTLDAPAPETAAINPKFFIDKKTDFLNKLFGQQTSSSEPVSTSQRDILGADDVFPSVQPQPGSSPTSFWSPILSPTEKIKFFTDKKTEFLDKLFKTISMTPAPETASESMTDGSSTSPKPTIVPPSFWVPDYKKPVVMGERALTGSVQQQLAPQAPLLWNPMLPPPAKAYSDKKADFLDKLFNSIMSPPVTAQQTLNEFDTLSTTVKPTIVPPSFWLPSYKKPSNLVQTDTMPQYVPASTTTENDVVLAFPFSPLVKGIPLVNPLYFIDKKNQFLAKLFQSLNASKPSTTEYPVDANTNSDLVGQLLNYMNATDTNMVANGVYSSSKRNSPDSEKIRIKDLKKLLQIIDDDSDFTDSSETNLLSERSVVGADSPSLFFSAKDQFVGNILTELANIKNNMLQAATELIQQQKTAASSATASMPGKKNPGTAYGSPYKMWGKASAVMPTADPVEPFVTKMTYLSHLFDTLTQLEKNMTLAIDQEAKNDATVASGTQKNAGNIVTANSRRALSSGPTNDQLAALQLCVDSGELSSTELSSLTYKPVSPDSLTTDALLDKSKKIFCHLLAKAEAAKVNESQSTAPIVRSIKMAVHQGYQSLPPGTEEILQAGGGGEAQNQEGGGLRLQNTGPTSGQDEVSNHHHHNHHH